MKIPYISEIHSNFILWRWPIGLCISIFMLIVLLILYPLRALSQFILDKIDWFTNFDNAFLLKLLKWAAKKNLLNNEK